MARIGSLRNLGPAMEAAFAAAGLETAEALRALGPDAAYGRLIDTGHRPHFMAYLALVAALQGRPWTDIAGSEKAALRAKFDVLLAGRQATPEAALERELDALGVRPRTGVSRPSG